jgi:hypothetical protein
MKVNLVCLPHACAPGRGSPQSGVSSQPQYQSSKMREQRLNLYCIFKARCNFSCLEYCTVYNVTYLQCFDMHQDPRIRTTGLRIRILFLQWL